MYYDKNYRKARHFRFELLFKLSENIPRAMTIMLDLASTYYVVKSLSI